MLRYKNIGKDYNILLVLNNLLVPAAVPANAASFSAEKQHFKNIK